MLTRSDGVDVTSDDRDRAGEVDAAAKCGRLLQLQIAFQVECEEKELLEQKLLAALQWREARARHRSPSSS